MDRGDVQDVDIHKDLENTLLVLRHKMLDTKVVREYDPALPRLSARGDELNQVWTNLIDNAIDAMESGGELIVKGHNDREFVVIQIIDNGSGISEEALSKIFDPFYTTKPIGKGTGLGLDIVHKIMKAHNADIKVESQPGQTEFKLCFPVQG
jgi:signal transduction histidine kinase